MNTIEMRRSEAISRHNMSVSEALLFLVFLIGSCSISSSLFLPSAQSECSSWNDPERMIGFALDLFKKGDYYRSITEMKKFLFLHPQHPQTPCVRFHMGLAYRKEEKWGKALDIFKAIAETQPQSELGRRAAYQYAETLYLSGNYITALRHFRRFQKLYPDDERSHLAEYLIGWCLLRLSKYERALHVFERIPLKNPLRGNSEKISKKILTQSPSSRYLSTKMAGVLSAALPGLGHFYCGKPALGIVSFLLNSAFIAGGIIAFMNEYYVTGGILTFFEMGWYAGGIHSAITCTKKYNKTLDKTFLETLHPLEGSGFSSSKKQDTICFIMQYHF